jgi:threonine dehydratase
MCAMPLVDLDDIRDAHALLAAAARRTPLEGSRVLSDLVGGPVLLKCENLQRTGSFKIRGAYTRIARLGSDERARGVVAASAGNHAQGVALAARLLGTTSTVFMPTGASLPKVDATTGYGARVELAGSSVDEALTIARTWADAQGQVLIHPFDHPDVIAGQGTVGIEIVEQCPDVATVVVCLGGGGLLSGIAAAVGAMRPGVRIVGVQAAGAAAWPGSLAAGVPTAVGSMQTIADGIAVGKPGVHTFEHVRALVDEVRTVTDEEISRALVLCLERAKLVVEPAGAAAVAAVLADPGAFTPPVVAVVSGGNVDPLLLGKVISHGLVAAGRYPALRIRVPDRPGSLARLLDVLATTGANLLDVEHHRAGGELALEDVDVALSLETRSAEHSADVRAALESAGYGVR